MTSELVKTATDGKIAIITLNRPDKLNAISPDLRHALEDAFAAAEDDPATSVVVLRAEGRSFCVGYDIAREAHETPDALEWHKVLRESLEFEMMPWHMAKPVIASVQGHALGGGCELAMFCDMTICADNALFGEPEVRFSAVGPAMVMPWMIGFKKARELIYFGDMIDAETALALGMVNRVVPLAELEAATMKVARRMTMVSPEALANAKIAINRGADAAGFTSAMRAGMDALTPLYAGKTEEGERFKEITRTEGLKAALAWRRAHFEE
jgi:enoyl-CoA hydratase/carnithine racemase